MNEVQTKVEFSKVVKGLEKAGGFLTRTDVDKILNDNGIDESTRIHFHVILNYNAITVGDLVRKYLNEFRYDDINGERIDALIIQVQRLRHAGKLDREDFIAGDLDYIGNCPATVQRFTADDAIELLKPFL